MNDFLHPDLLPFKRLKLFWSYIVVLKFDFSDLKDVCYAFRHFRTIDEFYL